MPYTNVAVFDSNSVRRTCLDQWLLYYHCELFVEWPNLEGDLAQHLQYPSNLMPSLTSRQPAPSCPHTALLKSVHQGFQT
ncbi:hypothetical protein AMECASPLE_029190 [Ameca splendens]|uniref:Uncharacterized protein n=1 Tax=Ameca splendens TaxID=208324 RepID=A0ABV0ZEI6_9TELE